MELEKQVLPEDLETAEIFIIAAEYYTAKMNYCLSKFNLEGAQYWSQEYQRVINDMKYLRFKKIDNERVGIDEKN